jgi:exopolysaccharide biosynthesis polyprenyl glycosylphosphotransferase
MRKYRLSFLFRPIATTLNILTLNFSIILSYLVKFETLNKLFQHPYLIFFWYSNLIWFLILLKLKPIKESRISFNITTLIFNYLKIVLILFFFLGIFFIYFKEYNYSRMFLLMQLTFTLIFGIIWRIMAIIALKIYRLSGFNNRKFVIFGKGELPIQIKKYYLNTPELGFKLEGIYNYDNLLLNDNFNFKDFLFERKIDIIYVCLPYVNEKDFKTIIQLSEKNPFEVKVISDFSGSLMNGINIEYHGSIPIFHISKKPYSDPKVEIFKRIFDLVISLLLLLFLSPLLIIIASITFLTSKGPLFYSQERIGRWGKPFNIYKFRSMYVGAEKNGPQLSSGDYDNRITKWGRFMRKTRIDEFPQFFNVLKGDMSIVGPRPEREFFISQIIKKAPQFNKLLTLRPGITSLGQIKYGYASSVEEMIKRMRFDLIYLRKYSIEADLYIIFLTIDVMLRKKGK